MTEYYEDGIKRIYKSTEEMQREETEKDRNSADAMLQQATDVATTDDPETTNCVLMAIAYAILALKGEVQRVADILDDRMTVSL